MKTSVPSPSGLLYLVIASSGLSLLLCIGWLLRPAYGISRRMSSLPSSQPLYCSSVISSWAESRRTRLTISASTSGSRCLAAGSLHSHI
ncbi:hypothetical protein B0T21DRAFT_448917 [Apiosordaria backusii]|uniref:Uncharacterized protein n=1 Tax=Apiosordaria backusii TaxID=314023 RepID=A0AA40K1C6_9PEZI|nr:hypothetical protein B0T21DRAFT_448917 [Apiosordaria backusii]